MNGDPLSFGLASSIAIASEVMSHKARKKVYESNIRKEKLIEQRGY